MHDYLLSQTLIVTNKREEKRREESGVVIITIIELCTCRFKLTKKKCGS